MKNREYILLFIIGLVFFGLLSRIQRVPGYMDAEYYYGQGVHMVSHNDLKEYFVWNFLNDQKTIPVDGFSFWLPVTSFLAAFGLKITNTISFSSSRILFIGLASIIPLLVARIATHFNNTRWAGWLAGGMALLSGFYLPFMTITDTFTPYMVLGGVLFLIFIRISENNGQSVFILLFVGLTIGLMSLTRSDGILWLIAGVVIALPTGKINSIRFLVVKYLFLFIGFMAIMVPWYWRNYGLYQSIMPPGNELMLWLNKYEDLFVYPTDSINFSNWISSGLLNIIKDRIIALGMNLQTLLAAGMAIFSAPILVIGIWKKRREIPVLIGAGMLIIIMGVMSVVFPYAGQRGGFFHSLSSLQVLFWALIPVGLDELIKWGCRKRNWKPKRAWTLFGTTMILLSVCLSGIVFYQKVFKSVEGDVAWNQTQEKIIKAEERIQQATNNSSDVVMVNNPPGYTLITDRPSVMIPTGGIKSMIDVCELFGVKYLILDEEREDVITISKTELDFEENFIKVYENKELQIFEYQDD